MPLITTRKRREWTEMMDWQIKHGQKDFGKFFPKIDVDLEQN